MNILALEFSSPQRSVAVVSVATDSEPCAMGVDACACETGAPALRAGAFESEVIDTSRDQAMKPLGMVETALRQAGLEREAIDCVTVGLGPGSYTGIRLAVSVAQGWQVARGVNLLGISSADCVAAQACAQELSGWCWVVIDAQREEFCLAGYELDDGCARATSPLRLATRREVQERERAGELIIGPEVTRWFAGGRVVFPRATALGRLAGRRHDFVSGEKLDPIYLREVNFVKAPPPREIL
ncbi:MAG: tRNA (adenosine(37)-N6)-threonylcarbamoyltransferase complex dimerization subunit type 1 TsaB [Verrucomicrobia bacterium]|nr:tRNA (adenosine(37)-N6)-threonylcarbamoyltransferase complex dimerization subunit type 1 TsaB [Verrucomicrobiota bacterium]